MCLTSNTHGRSVIFLAIKRQRSNYFWLIAIRKRNTSLSIKSTGKILIAVYCWHSRIYKDGDSTKQYLSTNVIETTSNVFNKWNLYSNIEMYIEARTRRITLDERHMNVIFIDLTNFLFIKLQSFLLEMIMCYSFSKISLYIFREN